MVGWDWFSLHLDDGSDLMYYGLRDSSGRATPESAGTLVRPSGEVVALSGVTLEETRRWQGWPVGWRLHWRDLDLRVDARVDDQLMDLSFRYWEGAVRVSGSRSGRGYLEMTGYRQSPSSTNGAQ